jgi:hypothetical protein
MCEQQSDSHEWNVKHASYGYHFEARDEKYSIHVSEALKDSVSEKKLLE